MVGLGLLLTQALGTSTNPIVQTQLAELIRFRETCRAFMIAAEETGFATPGGLFKPNNIYIDFGRAHYLENQHKMVNTLIDFRSEEHTSELQSLMRISYAVFCLKKKKT